MRVTQTPAPYRTSASGGRVPTELRNKPWPFDPREPKPRPQTWRNRAKIAGRWIVNNMCGIVWVIFCTLFSCLLTAIIYGKVL